MVNLIEFEDLRDAVLVGHSYAGIIVTGVADRIPGRLSLLAYLDAGPVSNGVAYLDTQSPEVRRLSERRVARRGRRRGRTLAGLYGEVNPCASPGLPYVSRTPMRRNKVRANAQRLAPG